MSTVLVSMWYADVGRHLVDRVLHLFAKQGIDRWLFSVRPSRDWTTAALKGMAESTGVNCDIFLEGTDQPEERIERLSKAGDGILEHVADEDYVLWHESDLFTPPDVAGRLMACGADACGGWPLLSHCKEDATLGLSTRRRIQMGEPIFYDTWGYRADGVRYTNLPPHHPRHDPTGPYTIDSVGSVVLIKADYIRRGARMHGNGLVGLCDSIREMGGTVMCDPRVPVVQPMELWTENND